MRIATPSRLVTPPAWVLNAQPLSHRPCCPTPWIALPECSTLCSPQCKENLFAETCAAGLNYLFYGPSVYISIDDFVVITQTWPANVASRNLGHFAQVGLGGC
jgi:hypothetical protein